MYTEQKFENLTELADEVIGKLTGNPDPFAMPVLCFHNKKAEQWFKAYYLKENDGVLMGARTTTLSLLVGDIINPDRKYTLMDRSLLEIYILKVLLDPKGCGFDPTADGFPYDYIYGENCTVKNGINLHELAGKMAALFLSYELSCEDIEKMGWESKLYQAALTEAGKNDCVTVGSLFAAGNFTAPKTPVYIIDNSYITDLFRKILRQCPGDNIHICTLEEETEKRPQFGPIISAPSMLREVEAVHTEICKLAEQFQKSDLYSSILVYAPSIGDYANTINRVFRQDDPKYPSIPYCIVGPSACQQDLQDSLSTLFDIANKRFFTRKDFARFVRNPSIRLGKRLTEAEIDTWIKVIGDTHTRRNGKGADDWKYLKTRMLLSLVVGETADDENRTEIGNTSWLPYTSMSLDPQSMFRMIDMIDLLEEWVALFGKDLKDILCNTEKQQQIIDCLDRMYSRLNTDGDERNYLYNEVKIIAERIKSLGICIPADTLLLILRKAPVRYTADSSDMFKGGVTFMSFVTDDVYSEPYVFVMGMSSGNFPGKDIRSELDRSENAKSGRELDALSMNHLLQNTEEKLTFSYVNHDLKKDEEFFPSASVTDLYPDPDAVMIKIPLDESREYGELFTKKEFREKKYFTGISSGTKENTEEAGQPEVPVCGTADSSDGSLPEISVSDIKKYLENTSVYKMEKLFGKTENEDDLLDEYEHIDLSGLESYDLVKSMTMADAAVSRERMDMEKKLPEGGIGDAYHTHLGNGPVANLKNEIKNGNYSLLKIDPLKLGNGSQEWLLKNSTEIYRAESSDQKEVRYLEPIDYWSKELKYKKYYNMYALSLMDVAGRSGDEEVHVTLGPNEKEKEYRITPSKAREKLNEIFSQMNDFTDVRYMDTEYVEQAAKDQNFDSLPSTVKTFSKDVAGEYGHSSWKYFSDRKLADLYKDLGYTDENIQDEIREMCRKVGKLILFDDIAAKIPEV